MLWGDPVCGTQKKLVFLDWSKGGHGRNTSQVQISRESHVPARATSTYLVNSEDERVQPWSSGLDEFGFASRLSIIKQWKWRLRRHNEPMASTMMSEQTSKWQTKMIMYDVSGDQRNRNPGSSTAVHIRDNENKTDLLLSFKPLLRNRSAKKLALSEALLIRSRDPL